MNASFAWVIYVFSRIPYPQQHVIIEILGIHASKRPGLTNKMCDLGGGFLWVKIFCLESTSRVSHSSRVGHSCHLILKHTPTKTNMAGWKIPMFNRKYIFKWWIFHCHVSSREGNFHICWMLPSKKDCFLKIKLVPMLGYTRMYSILDHSKWQIKLNTSFN